MQITTKFEILHSSGSDSVIIADAASHDDVAEVFHNYRHTVTQTVDQALETARLFAAAPELYEVAEATEDLFRELTGKVNEAFLDRFAKVHFAARAALAKARGEAL